MISTFSLEWGRDMSETFEEVKKLGVTGIDMESSCMLTLGKRLMGVKTCILLRRNALGKMKPTGQNEQMRKICFAEQPWKYLLLSYENGGRKK